MVQAALKANSDSFTLEHCLPSWTHRGKAVFQGGRFEREPVIFLSLTVSFRQRSNNLYKHNSLGTYHQLFFLAVTGIVHPNHVKH